MKRSRFLGTLAGGLTIGCGFLLAATSVLAEGTSFSGGSGRPEITAFRVTPQGEALLEVRVPPGFGHVVLEETDSPDPGAVWESAVASGLNGAAANLYFRVPVPDTMHMGLFRVRAGNSLDLPPAKLSALDHLRLLYDSGGGLIPDEQKIVHLLNRIAYGPSPDDYDLVKRIGVRAYIEQQLRPETIDESGNTKLRQALDRLHYPTNPLAGEVLAPFGDRIRYFKGTAEPPSNWTAVGFNDSGWIEGRTPIGTGHKDTWSDVDDMVGRYSSVYLRQKFTVADPSKFVGLNLTMFFDDGFVAYLNGVEVARHNVSGNPPSYRATADARGGFDSFVPDSPYFHLGPDAVGRLKAGSNVLAVQIHNRTKADSDFYGAAEIKGLSAPVEGMARGVDSLAEIPHARGIYGRRQLQAVLAEFWENHFTTDYDKVATFLAEHPAYAPVALQSKQSDLILRHQREIEAIRIEKDEFDFLHANALGHFGDLLLFSATSPSMLVYLDNVLNKVGAPNENYAREILELHSLGVDNGYTQTDIEQLAKCFTGWTIRKVPEASAKPFPRSALDPFTGPSEQVVAEETILGAGATWRYFKGINEPSPDAAGKPTANWANPEFPISSWFSGKAPFGYGTFKEEVARIPNVPVQTVLDDMRGKYQTAYVRTNFVVPALAKNEDLVLHLRYDDGFVAYLNGAVIGRSASLWKYDFPTDRFQNFLRHEFDEAGTRIALSEFSALLKPAPAVNTIAVEFHNAELLNPSFYAFPQLLKVRFAPDSVSESSGQGRWVFRFDPSQHDLSEKVLFAGMPDEIRVPANRTGAAGVRDALDVVEALPRRRDTAEFICLKLINRFVSDDITLTSYQDGTAPPHLIGLLDAAIAAWFSTDRPGHIASVMETILDPGQQMSPLWQEDAVWAKVKSPVEFVNGVFRLLGADLATAGIGSCTRDMGMWMFQRDEPDGFPEAGDEWVDTLTFRERVRLAQGLVLNKVGGMTTWDRSRFLQRNGITGIDSLIDWVDDHLFLGLMGDERRAVLRRFADKSDSGSESPFNGLSPTSRENRLAEVLALALSMPEVHYQ